MYAMGGEGAFQQPLSNMCLSSLGSLYWLTYQVRQQTTSNPSVLLIFPGAMTPHRTKIPAGAAPSPVLLGLALPITLSDVDAGTR